MSGDFISWLPCFFYFIFDLTTTMLIRYLLFFTTLFTFIHINTWVQAVLYPNLKMLEKWLSKGLMGCKELLTQKWAQEEKELMNQCLPGWDEDSEINVLTPSQELTCKLIQNQTLNIKVTKHNLFSARGLPEFPDSKWVKVLQGKAVDLDVIISRICSTVTDNWATETYEEFKFHFGHLKPTKTVRNHRDWLIAYSVFQHAMHFIYLYRESELIWYGEYITAYFMPANTGGQIYILNLDKVIHCWSGSVNNVSLDQFEIFRFLEVQHIFSKVAGDQSSPENQQGALAGQWGGGLAWWSKDLCQLFNQGRCMKQASDCCYRHICIGCGKEGHVEMECSSKKAWAVLSKG